MRGTTLKKSLYFHNYILNIKTTMQASFRFLLLCFVICLCAGNVFAQNEDYYENAASGDNVDFPNPRAYYSYSRKIRIVLHPILYYSPSAAWNGCLRSKAMPLMTSPLGDATMPADVKAAYAFFDSLYHKQGNNWNIVDTHPRYLYAIQDHNYLLYKQYTSYWKLYDTTYRGSPGEAGDAIRWNKNKWRATPAGRLKLLLMSSAGAYRIRIRAVESGGDSGYVIWKKPEPLECITATALDTLKGHTVLSCEKGAAGCLQFAVYPYAPCYTVSQFYPHKSDTAKRYYDVTTKKPLPNYSDFSWKPGNEFIVFLDMQFASDTTYDYWRYTPLQGGPQGGVFPIVNDMVQDSTNYYGMGTEVPVDVFENKVREAIAEIKKH